MRLYPTKIELQNYGFYSGKWVSEGIKNDWSVIALVCKLFRG